MPYYIRIFKYRSYTTKYIFWRGFLPRVNLKVLGRFRRNEAFFLLCIQCVSANLVSETDIFPDVCVWSLPLWIRLLDTR